MNRIELLGHYGDDTTIACSAWISTSTELTDERRARIPQMIARLWADGHHTPFEKGVVHFLASTDIATHIHLLKHRIGVSMNAESARYKELKYDDFLLPEDWINVKVAPFRTDHVDIDDPTMTWEKLLLTYTRAANELYHESLKQLTPILGRKRAKESARFFKTYNSQIEVDLMFNMRSFGHFLKLRDSEHAQVEVRELAQQAVQAVLAIEGNPFQHTLKAFGYE